MTLAGRMWIASAILAALVAAAFTALILAVDAQRSATAREHRSNDVTVATLQLEKLVVDMETGIRGFTLTADDRVSASRTRAPVERFQRGSPRLQQLVQDDRATTRASARAGAADQRVRRGLCRAARRPRAREP